MKAIESILRELVARYPRTSARLLTRALERRGAAPLKQVLFDELAKQGCPFPNAVAELILGQARVA